MKTAPLTEGSSLSLRDRRAVAARARICEAALEIVTREGFEALTMQRIAEALGCAAGGIYRYFPSKSELVLALLQEVIGALLADFTEAFARLESSPALRALSAGEKGLLRAMLLFETYFALRRARPTHAQVIALALSDPKELVGSPESGDTRYITEVRELSLRLGEGLSEGVAEGLISEGDWLARLISLFGAMHGVLQLAKLERLKTFNIDAENMARELMHTIFGAWAPRPEALTKLYRHATRLAHDKPRAKTTKE